MTTPTPTGMDGECIDFADGRKVKVMIKEVYKHTAACDACRVRKRKCDGKAPCSYCVAKNQTCTFSKQRKRGPQKRQKIEAPTMGESTSKALSLVNVNYEGELLDRIEASNYFDFYLRYINLIMPSATVQNLKSPITNSHKVQSYAALAYSSRVCGDLGKAKMYINQARTLAGTIFDSPDQDTIAALLMMSNYWQLVLDVPLAYYYCNIACSLSRLTKSPMRSKLRAFCETSAIMTTETLNHKEQAVLLRRVARQIREAADFNDRCCGYFLEISSFFLGIFDLNILFPDPKSLLRTFEIMDNVKVNEEQRADLMDCITSVNLNVALTSSTLSKEDQEQLRFLYSIFTPLYSTIVEWKSGHTKEALNNALQFLNGLKSLKSANVFGILAEHPQLCFMGGIVKFFYEQGHNNLALEMCGYINIVCKIMAPEYDFITQLTEDFSKMNLRKDTSNSTASSSPSPSFSSPSPSSSSSPFSFSFPTSTSTSSTSTSSSTSPASTSPVSSPSQFPTPASPPYNSPGTPPLFSSSEHSDHFSTPTPSPPSPQSPLPYDSIPPANTNLSPTYVESTNFQTEVYTVNDVNSNVVYISSPDNNFESLPTIPTNINTLPTNINTLPTNINPLPTNINLLPPTNFNTNINLPQTNINTLPTNINTNTLPAYTNDNVNITYINNNYINISNNNESYNNTTSSNYSNNYNNSSNYVINNNDVINNSTNNTNNNINYGLLQNEVFPEIYSNNTDYNTFSTPMTNNDVANSNTDNFMLNVIDLNMVSHILESNSGESPGTFFQPTEWQ